MSKKEKDNLQTAPAKPAVNKLLVVIIILMLIIIAGGSFCVWKFVLSVPQTANQVEVNDDGTIGLAENDSFLILDEDDVVDINELQKKADEGMMDLSFSNVVTIENGTQGTCNISNEASNNYDMYVSIWLDDTQEEIYRSGILPIGSHIEQLELNQPLEVGVYNGIMVYNQIEDNKIARQVNVAVTIDVKS